MHILLTDYVHQDLITRLVDSGHRVTYAPEAGPAEVKAWIAHFDGLIVNTKTPVDREMMEKAPGLQFVGRLGVGLDIFDLEYARERGIEILATPGANANAVGEHMFAMLLCLLRKIVSADNAVRRGAWLREQHRGEELAGKTVGIIGYGNTGSAFAAKFAGWQTNILAYDKYKERYADGIRFVEEVHLERVIAESDIISFHVPLTGETRFMADADFFARCKRGVIVLNGSRGKVIRTTDLLDAMRSGQVGGACLDVLENEKLETLTDQEKRVFDELRKLHNVIFTPHIAGWTWTSKRNIASGMAESIIRRFG